MLISEELLRAAVAPFGLTLDDGIVARFDLYARLLRDYNEKVNLTAITDPDGIVVKHFADSLALAAMAVPSPGTTVCDVGTGAGFPGLCLLIYTPSLSLTLMDAVNKKLDFIRFVLAELGLAANVVHVRAEDAGKDPAYRERFELVTARAVAQLNVLAEYAMPLVKVGGRFAPMKAPLTAEEKQRGFGAVSQLGGKLAEDRRYELADGSARELILFQKISQTSPKYPRNAAQISKKPL